MQGYEASDRSRGGGEGGQITHLLYSELTDVYKLFSSPAALGSADLQAPCLRGTADEPSLYTDVTQC